MSRTIAVRIRGRIEEIYFTSSTFSAGCLRSRDGEKVKFAGSVLLHEEEPVILHGHWVEHPKYGHQLEVEAVELDLDLDPEGLAHYLANCPAIRGIGPAKARRIANRFGANFEHSLVEEPQAIADEAGISLEKVEALRDEWQRTKMVNAALVWLSSYKLTNYQVTTLVEKYGSGVVAILKADPYLIIREIPGFGFRRVDQIALAMGTAKDHPSRLQAGVLYCVQERLERGDCWVESEHLIELSNALLILDRLGSRKLIERTLDDLVAAGDLVSPSHGGRFLIALPEILRMEEELAAIFSSGSAAHPHFTDDIDPAALIEKHSPDLNIGQRDAVGIALKHQMSLIAGGAGSGKTYVSAVIATICHTQEITIVLAAPTGKAAKRLEQIVGQEAFTIHRLLGYDGHNFAHDAARPLEMDVLIVDEVSMLDVPLAWHLFQAIDPERTAVVLVGDHNQLPPVGPGNILRDLIETQMLPAVILTEIVRQAGPLKENSIAVLRGEVHKTTTSESARVPPWILINNLAQPERVIWALADMHRDGIAERMGFDLITEVQVLTPTHKGPLGTLALNAELQRLLQKKLYGVDVPAVKAGRRLPFLLYDKVIQTRNNYDLGVMNGAVGQVTAIESDGTIEVSFNDQVVAITPESGHLSDLSLAYALTIHKAQGSEWKCVVLVVHRSHNFQHHRNLFYSGVTRAEKVAIILGDSWGIRNCAARQETGRRKTFLALLGQRSEGRNDQAIRYRSAADLNAISGPLSMSD